MARLLLGKSNPSAAIRWTRGTNYSLLWRGKESQPNWLLWWVFFSPILCYCKTLFFHYILISRFSYVEKLLYLNLVGFLVSNFICCQNSCRIIVYVLPRILHITSRKCCYSMQINLWWWAIPTIHMYLISPLY